MLIAFVVALAPLPATAQELAPRATLTFTRDPSASRCGDESEFRDAVRSRLGRNPFDQTATVHVDLELQREGATIRAELRLFGPEHERLGRRTLRARGSDCASLLASAALATSVALEALPPEAPARSAPLVIAAPAAIAAPARTQPVVDSPPEAPTPQAAPTPSTPTPPAPAARADARPTTPAPRSTLAVLLTLGATGAFGTHPGLSLGGEATVGLRWRWLSVAAGARADVPASASFDEPRPTGARIQSTWAAIVGRACGHWRVLSGCALWSSGSFGATAMGLDANRSGSVWAHYAGLGAHFAYPERGVLRVRARLEALVPVVGPSIVAQGMTLWTAPAMHGTLGVDALAEF